MGGSYRLPTIRTTHKFPPLFLKDHQFLSKFFLPYLPVIPQISPDAPFRALESCLWRVSLSETAV